MLSTRKEEKEKTTQISLSGFREIEVNISNCYCVFFFAVLIDEISILRIVPQLCNISFDSSN